MQHSPSSSSSKSLRLLFGLVALPIALGMVLVSPAHAGMLGTYDLIVTSDMPPIFVSEAEVMVDLTIELVGAGVCTTGWGGITWGVAVDLNGTAGPGDVGNPIQGSLSFSDVTPSANLQVALTPDAIDEPDETFEISLTPLNELIFCSMPAGTIGPNLNDYRILVTIVDDDLGLEFVIQDTQVIEGDSGSPNVEVTIDMLNGPIGQDVNIDWNTSDGTATTNDNDYLPAGGTLTIFSGQTFTKALIPVVGDTTPEPNETFNVTIFNPSQGMVIDANADVTILDDDTGPPLELVVQDALVVEGDAGLQDVEVTIDLVNGPAPFDVTMSWTTFDGTATTDDNDYQFADGFITIPAGDTSTKVLVSAIGDTVEEPDEFFEVKIFDAIGADITDERGDVTIQNDDGPMFSVSVVDAQAVTEGDSGLTSMVFTIEVDALGGQGRLGSGRGRTLPPMSIDFQALPGAAATNIDFQAISGTLNIVDDSDQTVIVRVIGDTVEEPNENLFLRLSDPINVVIGDNEGEGVILDDDSPVGELSVADAQVDEGDEGSTEMVFEVHLAPAQDSVVQVSYETLDGTATIEGGDYQSVQGQLTYQPGQTLQTVSVPVNGDLEVEGNELFQLRIFDPTGADLADDLGDGTIVDDDVETLPTIHIGDASGLEGDSGSTQVELSITLSQPADEVVEVSYTTSDGTATAGTDYQADSGTATIQPGETSTTLTVAILGDTVEEGDEFFTVVLSEPQGAELGDAEGQVTVVDDDQPPILSIEDAQVVEGDQGEQLAIFTLRLEQQTRARIMVDYTTRDGTALASDNDYVPVSGRLDFDSGESTVVLEVPVIGDLRPEDDETFFIDLSSPDGAVLGDATAQGLIVDDDSDGGGPGGSAGSIRLIQAESAMEGAGPAVIQVERFGGSTGVVSVLVSTTDSSATAGQDYQAVSQRIQWANGQSGPQAIEVPVLNDAVREDGEVFGVVLSNPVGAGLANPSQISVSIVDDDTPMALEAVGELQRTATVRTEQVFQVRVVTEAGDPVEGAVVQWSAEGQARLPDEGRTMSGADGLAEQTVLFGNRPGDASILARLVGSDEPLAYAVEVQGDLSANLGDGEDGGSDEPGVAGALDESCADAGSSRYSELCDFVYGLADTENQRDVVDQLTPRSTLAQAKTTLRAPAQQVRNVTSRLSALRGGATGSAFGQLAFAVQGDSISLGPLQQAVLSYNEASTGASSGDVFERPLSRAIEAGRPAESPLAEIPWRRGGAASGDEEEPYEDLDAYDSTESPWGFFMNGRASFGDAPRRGADPGYDFSTQGLTAGVDYRVSDQWVVGTSIGYSRADMDLAGVGGRRDGGSIDTEGLSLSVFTSWYREDFYLDGVVTFGQTDLDTERVIVLPSALNGQDRFVAAGAPDGDELSLHLGFGYDFRIGEALNLSGFLNGNYVRATVDSYTEAGADLLNLVYEEQELESLLAEVGVEITYPYSLSWGVVQPLVRIAFLRELEDDPQIIRARFAEDPNGRRFRLVSERPDRSYLNIALGLTATLQRGWATYFQYDTDLERDDLDIYTLSGGFRFQF